MTYYEECKRYQRTFLNNERFLEVTPGQIERMLQKPSLSPLDYLILLSEPAGRHLEQMAQKASVLTKQNFGKVIFLFTPLYLANYCVNKCAYCGFNTGNHIRREKLTLEEVEKEAREIAKTGLKHILILTGESRQHSPVSYINDCARVLRKYFSSVSIEVYPLEQEEYAQLVAGGVDGMTMFQEVYDEGIYDRFHLAGPKKNYRFRIEAPERAGAAGMRTINIGALLGLNGNWRHEAFLTGMHAAYLQNKYRDAEVSVSLPRLRSHTGTPLENTHPVGDKELVQTMLALRLFLPRVGITISTREKPEFRNNLLGLGVTRMSASSSTSVGGHYNKDKTEAQFDISDPRTVEEMHRFLLQKGYQPVYKDWEAII